MRLRSLSFCGRLKRRFIELLDIGVVMDVVVLDESEESDADIWEELSLLYVIDVVDDDELIEEHNVLLVLYKLCVHCFFLYFYLRFVQSDHSG